ncbi:ubiquitin carboxyl-terminal hydrolase isozyme L3 [Lingula anatina]|uniref:Ubiquitin carboxyl-terminal hydrolase n=1 Tax=Lingula anatina TaxID=7574 RepID=A0A1S3HJE1_LINAN|nr:ubiquitin carboxyl-terminal hydrolase isozyme L3 [Lingula anatina]|eukprot:XP_013386238.1 ubiquitin carboxyl-terminal hydrolase isozyme L3 [Lingula anatina]
MAPRWLPLESNPDVMNKFVKQLGLQGPYGFVDVFGLDADLLTMVPRPVAAVLLLYPISEKSEATALGVEEENKEVYFIKQTIGNACGTIGVIHALANNTDKITLAGGNNFLANFLAKTKDISPDERAKKLEIDPVSTDVGVMVAFFRFHIFVGGNNFLANFLAKTKDISPDERAKKLEIDPDIGAAHEASAQEGQTQPPPIDEKVDLHFVTFVHNNGGLYELDGRKNAPKRHGNTTADTLLEDAAAVVKKFMARDPDNIHFTVVALAKTD